MTTKLLILSALLFVLVGCSEGCNLIKPTPTPEPSPTPVPAACDPVTQPAPHYGMKNGVCLKSCGALGGTQSSDEKTCEEMNLVSAGPSYDRAYCCKNPNPPPGPTPAKCPCLRRWGVKPHIYMDGRYQMVDKPVQGGFILFDTTPRFGDGNGTPCNAEKDGCGGRKCEDLRGPEFQVIGDQPSKVQSDNPFQLKVGPLNRGSFTVRAKPRLDLKDEHGQEVNICSGTDAVGTTTVTVP